METEKKRQHIARYVQRIRTDLGLDKDGFAKSLRLAQRTVYSYEEGKRVPGWATAIAMVNLANAAGHMKSLDDMFGIKKARR